MKKLMKIFLASVLLLAMTAVSVCAEGSPSQFPVVLSWEAYDARENGNKLSKDEYKLVFKEVALDDAHMNDQEQYDLIVAVDNQQKTISDLLNSVGVMPSGTKNVSMVMRILDLTFVRKSDETQEVDAYNVTVTFEVPSLVEGTGNIYVYHHSTLTGKDELVTPIKVDYANKAITVKLADLSPITVVGVQKTQKPVDTATVDYTALFALAALASGLALYAVNKKEKTAA